ncbi:MAG: hypothetical protein F6K04_08470 [Leptolyngbya sp. SIO4C5]|nr:hypothetical protein [Leptolyngbya sp. SIO4C5]
MPAALELQAIAAKVIQPLRTVVFSLIILISSSDLLSIVEVKLKFKIPL